MKGIAATLAVLGLGALLLPQALPGRKGSDADPVSRAARKACITLCLVFMALSVLILYFFGR